jgi:predicted RNA binding protein YcfA (HicA-like mRNA interferase family)
VSDLPAVNAKQAMSAFGKLGFAQVRTHGSHVILKKSGHRFLLAVPCHGKKELKPGTLRSLIRASGHSVDEFAAALTTSRSIGQAESVTDTDTTRQAKTPHTSSE